MIFLCSILLVYGNFLNHNVKGQISKEKDINDFFASSFQVNNTLPDIPDAYIKNFTINIENIDPQRVRRKFLLLQPEIKKKEDILRQARRQTLTYTGKNRSVMEAASKYMTRTKAADLMLQVIYMAKQKIKLVEENPSYSANDPEFKVGYVYDKMRDIAKKIRIIKNTIHQYEKYIVVQYVGNVLQRKTMGPAVILHTKAVRLYVDFVYLWKVFITVDQYKMDALSIKHVLAPNDKTGGFTDEDVLPPDSYP